MTTCDPQEFSNGPTSAIVGAEGITLLSTGLVVIREDWRFVDDVLQGKASDKPRAFRVVLTLNHEAVHFIQLYTCAFLYSLSLNFVQLAFSLMTAIRENRSVGQHIRYFRKYLDECNDLLVREVQGVSALDLAESMAAVESYRSTVPDIHAASLPAYLTRDYPLRTSPYTKVYNLVSRALGADAAYDWTSRLCFLALNGDDPARNFWLFLRYLENEPEWLTRSTTDLARRTDMDLSGVLLNQSRESLPPDGVHSFLLQFLSELSVVRCESERFALVSNPSSLLNGQANRRFPGLNTENFFPPIIVCSGNRGKVIGRAKTWSKEEHFMYLDAAALVGATMQLLSTAKSAQTCHSTACPLHSSGLCYAWYAKPHTIPWQQCAFPKRLRLHYGMDCDRLTQVFDQELQTA